uniref:VTT domain-containing protein n=1 Tax=Helicotheca tamesis TaxID=374047 RepID=A0A7S2MII1_9STRA|mmetsp:Transcript_16695/g.22869  ORF Transcript_16695/g.22869 Transcript_16695/m.22869 type:complete len:305 (+) Transcript_16695:149-1063(+)|eukprot:CAMPEP_0185727630 /NCGR_PEP_ID=MMETSP1171-20130828/3261_1 /TAXON_ID=374046 /ORGANISM="Helicotheca tamensis, Strain CCMP826" /LENGTH=304 /DNA_ID=CAMNT_0028396233 /DNA_START=95 /DNA_END=1009 /DNA_ORIENTATION=+
MSSRTSNVEDEESSAMHIAEQAREKRKARLIKIALGLLLVGFIIYVIVDFATSKHLRTAMESFLNWIEDNPTEGVFAFMGVYFVATILFAPGLILTLGAGFVFANALGLGLGVVLATTAVFVGASTGSMAAFLIGRYLLRDWVVGLTKKYAIFEAVDVALKEKGLRIMILLRLSPLIPFNALNYIVGVTSVSFRDFTIAMIGILPGTLLYVFLGSSAGSLTDSSSGGDNSAVRILTIVLGSVFGILGVCVTSYYARKELQNVISRREAEAAQLEVEDIGDKEMDSMLRMEVGESTESGENQNGI